MKGKTTMKATKPKPFEQRCRTYMQEDGKLLEKLGLTKRLLITFRGGSVPMLSKIAISIIRAQGGILDTELRDLIH